MSMLNQLLNFLSTRIETLLFLYKTRITPIKEIFHKGLKKIVYNILNYNKIVQLMDFNEYFYFCRYNKIFAYMM